MNRHLIALEFDKVLQRVLQYAKNADSAEIVQNLLPFRDLKSALGELERTKEAHTLLSKYGVEPLGHFDPMKGVIAKITMGATLNMGELLSLANFFGIARNGKASILNCEGALEQLKMLANAMYTNKSLEDDIKISIISDSEMSDAASTHLASIRRKIRKTNDRIREKLSHYITGTAYSKVLQENVITIRQGRFVIPVKSECRGQVSGLVHDQSASGATVFIEPMPVVELNNELRLALIEEAKEIERVLEEFSSRAHEVVDQINRCYNLCVELDVVLCKARYAIENESVFPKLNQKKNLKIIGGRHPLIERGKVVPVSVEISSPNSRVLLISGPNTGGKTVLLKTIGLFCLMAASGMFVPSEEGTELTVFENIYCDIGDAQSIQLSLSTFSSHMSNIRDITAAATSADLVIFDELGAGTDPYEGAALSIGILRYLLELNCVALITTHYKELKEFSFKTSGIINASMEYNLDTMLPTYRVIMGLAGVSNAINIASHIGIKPKIIEYSLESINKSSDDLETILANAHKASNAAEIARLECEEAKRRALEELRIAEKLREETAREKERISKNAKQETKRLISRAVEEANDIIEQMRENIEEADRQSLLGAKHARNRLSELTKMDDESELVEYVELNEPPKVGEEVFIKAINAKARVVSNENKRGQIEVAMGTIMAKFKRSELGKVLNKKVERKVAPVQKQESVSTGELKREIKLLGYTVFEAETMLDEFLSTANRDGVSEVKIIHGLGTGALKKGVHEYLKRSPFVSEFRLGRIGEGDRGVTIAQIR